jgi:hypothetical protein
MAKDTLDEIKRKIEANSALKEKDRAELLRLLASLKTSVEDLARTHAEHAQSIAGFLERSTEEATRREKNPALMKLALEGLSTSVKGFEVTHRRLVEDVNYICVVLGNMGI